MSSTLMTTALPRSRAAGAEVHVVAFVTHKLLPQAAGATLADFPAVRDWVETLQAGSFELLASHLAAPVPVQVVAGAQAATWHAVLPPDVPVAGYPTPAVSGATWQSYPAHRVGDGAVDLHLAQVTAAPTAAPGVVGNPVLGGVLGVLAQTSRVVTELLDLAERRGGRAQELLTRKVREAWASLGITSERLGYPTEDLSPTSAVEVLLAGTGQDAQTTAWLDDLLGTSLAGSSPELQLLVDAHAARRFYQRPEAQTPYRDRPIDGHQAPRPERPEPDFHARVASFAGTPSLLTPLGLAVDLVIPDPQVRAGLDAATWLAVRFVPAAGSDLTILAPPRTQVLVHGDLLVARSSDAWIGGAVPLGDDSYVVLDVDPDASGLKTEQHLRDLPRTLASEVNGDPASAAPATLRSTGFAIARSDRVEASRGQVTKAEAMATPPDGPGAAGPDLLFDDLVRGVRLEVWDDVTRTWHSLHERRVTVVADPGTGERTTVLDDVPDVGFLQLSGLNRVPGSDANPYYLHEVIAGWDGWSLSAPRPGKVVVRDGGVETVVDAPPDDPATGVLITSRVEPGSLPRLRHGTSYAFRMVGVDLVGGSVPRRASAPGPGAPGGPGATVVGDLAAARAHLDRLRGVYTARDSRLVPAVRDQVLAALPQTEAQRSTLLDLTDDAAPPLATPRGPAAVLPDLVRTGDAELDAAVAARVAGVRAKASGRPDGPSTGVLAGGDVTAAMHAAASASRHLAASAPTWRVRPQLSVDPAVLAGLAAVPDLSIPPHILLPGRPVVTVPRPFLRWDPVPPPAVVARTPLTTGEQLSRLVLRTGLPPGSPDAAASSERHLAPPKATMTDAEVAGRFDEAIGSADPARQRAAYGWALRERGTLLDQFVPDPANPGQEIEQPGIALHRRPGADPATLVTLAEITAHRDTPLGEGQYVVHDVDQLVLPYLPDPYAAGIGVVFYDAGAPHHLPEPRVLQAVVLPFDEAWPAVRPFRLVLEAGDRLGARLDGTAIRVALPAGTQVRAALSSIIDPDDLTRFGLWRSHLASAVDPASSDPADVVAALALQRAASSGWTWWLTPSVDLRLVHAVPAPVRPPELVSLRVLARPAGLTVAQLAGLVDLHGPSTDRLVVRAHWTEQTDDLAAPGPSVVARDDVVVRSAVATGERWGLLTFVDFLPFGPAADMLALAEGGLGLHRAVHTFADTHHRRVTYRPSGLTRYAEMFDPADLPDAEDPALAGEPVTLTIPSSARPAAPDLVDAAPLLHWEEQTEPDQPFALRRTRRSGVRLWLRRPWFSSGDGELLGVVVSRTGKEPDAAISLWGRDPMQIGAATGNATTPPLLTLGHLLVDAIGDTVVDEPARPVLPVAAVGLQDLKGSPLASVLAYRPEFHPDRGQWHVDIAVDDVPAQWPFLRLAVARYQPDSIDGCELSPVGLSSWVQPLPTRTATVSRPDADHVRVTVTGGVSLLRLRGPDGREDADLDADTPTGPGDAVDRLLALSRTMWASVQVLPDGAGDLQWRTVARRRLPAVGLGAPNSFSVTWTGALRLPDEDDRDAPLHLRTPGSQTRWRVVVEEHELLDADAAGEPNIEGHTSISERVVYADTFTL